MSSTKKHYATRDFTDAGTTKAFKAGEPVDADAGELANYAAAGLVTTDEPKTTTSKAADTPPQGNKPA